jgi:hypothetical protein
MKEFMLVFRNAQSGAPKLSPEQLQDITKPWQDWIGGIAAQGKLVDRGNRLDFEGATVSPGNVVTDGPYAEIKEILLGYTIVKTDAIADAIEIAKGCPILQVGGNVEVRTVVQMNL